MEGKVFACVTEGFKKVSRQTDVIHLMSFNWCYSSDVNQICE